MSALIQVEPAGEGAYSANPAERLGPNEFPTYLSLCRAAGLRFDQGRRKQVGPIDSLPRLLAEFERAGFELIVAPELRASIEAEVNATKERDAEGVERARAAEQIAKAKGLALYPFQREGVRWLAPRSRALLGDEMGLGKTVQGVCALDDKPAVLVIVPAAVKGNWRTELRKWRPDLRVEILEGRGSFRWPRAGEVVITNYDILQPVPEEEDDQEKAKLIPPLPRPGCPVYVIADEAHLVKNKDARRTTRFRAASRATLECGGAVWLLTGTPLLNRPDELWNVLDAADLAREAFGSWPNFVRLFGGYKGSHGWEWGTPSPEVPSLLRKVALVRRRADVLPDLPSKTRSDIEVPIDAKTRQLCDEVLAHLRSKGVDIEDVNCVVDETRIAGAGFELVSRARAALAVAKMTAAMEIVEEYETEGVPLVVFSYHRMAADMLAQRPGWVTITGDTSAAERTAIVERFQRGELKGIAGTIQAMGVGVTLTHAHHALFVDLAWTPALNNQAEDRICRIGQDRGVIVKRLVADHALDYRVLQLITEKQIIIDGSVNAAAVQVGAVNDEAAKANAERLAKAAAMGSIFSSSAVVDPQEIERHKAAKVEERERARDAAQKGERLRRQADVDEQALCERASAVVAAGALLDARVAPALATYLDRAGEGLNDLEWAAFRRMAEKVVA